MTRKFHIKKDLFYFVPIGLFLILVAGLRPIGIDRDSLEYVKIHGVNIKNANFIDKEPTFWIINEFNRYILGGSAQTFFLIYAILGVSLKLAAIRKYSLLPILSIFTYISLYFILHEMTQIRAGVATAVFLFALEDIKNRNLKGYVFKTIVAMLFHYSAIIMLLAYFIKPNKLNLRLFFFLPIVGILLAIFKNINLNVLSSMTFILPEILASKIKLYILLLEHGKHSDINIFNFLYLSLLFIYYCSLLNHKKMKSEYDIVFIKILGIMLFSFYSLSFLPVLAFRVSEFFGVVLIFLIPHVLLAIKEKTIAGILFVMWLVVYFVYMIINHLNL